MRAPLLREAPSEERTVAPRGGGYRCRVAGSSAVAASSRSGLVASEPAAIPPPARPLRVLFVVEPGALLRFALLVPALAERGHEVHVAFARGRDWVPEVPRGLPSRTASLVEELRTRYPRLHFGFVPERGPSGWSDLAVIARGLADLAHNADPRYTGADALRRRTKKRILGRLEHDRAIEPFARRLALRAGTRLTGRTDAALSARMLRRAAALEEAVPSAPEVDRFVRGLGPDVVVATGTFRHVSSEVDVLKSARRLGIPTGIFVTSWDNLTNKGAMKFVPERVLVWNEAQAREAVELHQIPPDRVRVTGAHVFDEWFERRPTRSRDDFLRTVGLGPGPYLVYLCSSRNVARSGEVDFVRAWIEALRSSSDERLRRIGVIVRPHPNAGLQWQDVELSDPAAVVWPRTGAHPVAEEARADFFDTLAHAAAVVGINTTAMIEAAILEKSVLTVLVPRFTQETSLHFHHLLTENGGFLNVATDLEEHTRQLVHVLDEDGAGAARRRAFVASFVRPNGLDRPAAPIGAAAIEELAAAPVPHHAGLQTKLLRGALSLEARLGSVHHTRHATAGA
jgi:hypothetical protein